MDYSGSLLGCSLNYLSHKIPPFPFLIDVLTNLSKLVFSKCNGGKPPDPRLNMVAQSHLSRPPNLFDLDNALTAEIMHLELI